MDAPHNVAIVHTKIAMVHTSAGGKIHYSVLEQNAADFKKTAYIFAIVSEPILNI